MSKSSRLTRVWLLIVPVVLSAQQLSNIVTHVSGDSVRITYDLGSLAENEAVTVGFSVDSGFTWKRITDAEGDLDLGVEPGRNREIRFRVHPPNIYHSTIYDLRIIDFRRMVWIEGGRYKMGNFNGKIDEKPEHIIEITGFFISRHEVTQAEYRQIIGNNPSQAGHSLQCPVVNVSWEEAIHYCRKTSGRLPSEAEWEYAARGGNRSGGYIFSGANDLNTVGWYNLNSSNDVQEIAKKLPNEAGLFDMSGNVWEWCADWYDVNYYSLSPEKNPSGPETGRDRVVRGGSWASIERYCRVTNRGFFNPHNGYSTIGFRIVRDF